MRDGQAEFWFRQVASAKTAMAINFFRQLFFVTKPNATYIVLYYTSTVIYEE